MISESELRSIFLGLTLTSKGGRWCRAIKSEYLWENPQPLWGNGTLQVGARFVPKGAFKSIHLASDPFTAFMEVEAVFQTGEGKVVWDADSPWTWVAVEVVVENVLDLANPEIWAHLQTSESELTGNWRNGEDHYLRGEGSLPPTQLLGKVAYESQRVFGICYPSAKNTGRAVNLVVFPDRLQKGGASYLQALDRKGVLQMRLP